MRCLNGCTLLKLPKAERMGKFLFIYFFQATLSRMAVPPRRFSFQIKLSGVQSNRGFAFAGASV